MVIREMYIDMRRNGREKRERKEGRGNAFIICICVYMCVYIFSM